MRRQLDSLGASETRIVVTGDLDEHSIQALAVAPVDGYGVGTSLVTGSGAPTVSLVYKLVARARGTSDSLPWEPVAKRSVGKPSRGGRKWSVRRFDGGGTAVAEEVFPYDPPEAVGTRPLLRPLVSNGDVVGRESVHDARDRHREALAELPEQALRMSRGEAALPTVFH